MSISEREIWVNNGCPGQVRVVSGLQMVDASETVPGGGGIK